MARELVGQDRRNLRAIESALGVTIAARGNLLTIGGEATARLAAEALVGRLIRLIEAGFPLASGDVAHAAALAARGQDGDLTEYMLDTILVTDRRRPVSPRSPNQKRYVDAIRAHDLVFGVGPAGTGKTYLAVAMACAALQAGDVRRIVLTRPAVEAGEKLGFLPGDLAEKVDPYLRPLYDALNDMLSPARTQKFMEQGTIEVAPLAFMRGRTLSRCFVIMDEAQNTSREQMKMFLTRLGPGSKAVVTGDITQIDLDGGRASGLIDACRVLRGIDEIPFIEFEKVDVVRHPLVRRIIAAYEVDDARRDGRPAAVQLELPAPEPALE